MFKKILVIILSILTLNMVCFGCVKKDEIKDVENKNDLTNFDLEKYLQPIWDGDIVYNESVFPLENRDGYVDPIQLLYEATEIISVRNGTMDIKFKEGKDYKLTDGKLEILEFSKISTIARDEYYLSTPDNPNVPLQLVSGGYTTYREDKDNKYFHNSQLNVTYKHKVADNIAKPINKSSKLPKLNNKLKNKESVDIVYLGDSIAVGANSSQFINAYPFTPNWTKLIVDGLKHKFNYDNIRGDNSLAVGGETSVLATKKEVLDKLKKKKCDLLVLHFGINDSLIEENAFIDNIMQAVSAVQEVNKDVEIVFMAPMLANVNVIWGNINSKIKVFKNKMLEKENVGQVVDVMSVCEALLSKKQYYDITGNNINHPNDFLTRVYAQTFIATIIN